MAKNDKKKTRQAIKIKKKKWFTIVTPAFLGKKPIGESYLVDAEQAFGRVVEANLMNLTGDVRNQSSSMKFEITDFKDHVLNTKIISYEMSSSTIKRFVRRKMNKVDDSFTAVTKDGITIRIKPVLLTKGNVSRSIEYRLRAELKKDLIEYINKTPYVNIFDSVLKRKIQKDLKTKLTKLHPVRSVEVRVIKAVDRASVNVLQEVKIEKVKEEKSEEEKTSEESTEKEVKKTSKKEKSETKKEAKPKKAKSEKKEDDELEEEESEE